MVFFRYEASSVCETKKNISSTQKFIFRLQNIFLASQKNFSAKRRRRPTCITPSGRRRRAP
jgi:hypothetical protein